MYIQDAKLIDIVPPFLRDDQTVRGLCAAADAMYKYLMDAVYIAWWRKYIDQLDSKYIDTLAHLIGIEWYDDGADLQLKRYVLKNYKNIVSITGTPEAVRIAIEGIFDEAEVIEWPEYGGQPFHFKLYVDSQFTEDNTKRFKSIVRAMKNVRSVMDSLDTMRSACVHTYVGGKMSNTYVCDVKTEGIENAGT